MNPPFVSGQLVVCVRKRWVWGNSDLPPTDVRCPRYDQIYVVESCYRVIAEWWVYIKGFRDAYVASGFRPIEDFQKEVNAKTPEEVTA